MNILTRVMRIVQSSQPQDFSIFVLTHTLIDTVIQDSVRKVAPTLIIVFGPLPTSGIAESPVQLMVL